MSWEAEQILGPMLVSEQLTGRGASCHPQHQAETPERSARSPWGLPRHAQGAAADGPGGRSSPERRHLDGDTEPPDGMRSQGGDGMGEEAGTKLGAMLGDRERQSLQELPGGLMSSNPSEEAGVMAGARRCRH